jgi:hypothetical protein
MQMKTNILLFLACFTGTLATHAQFVYKWDAKFFSFSSPFELTRIQTNSADEFNWQNDEYTIEISAFGIGYYNTYYGGQDIKKVAQQVAVDQSFYDIDEMEAYGDSLPLIPSGYYLLAKTPGMDANQYACVIVVVGFNEKRKIYFEARIYCFNNKYKKGIEIAKSFNFDK